MLPLASLPREVLVNVLDRLPALNLFLVTHLSGDRHLWSKVTKGGVTALRIEPKELMKLRPEYLADFGGLLSLSIDLAQEKTIPFLHELPHTITSLTIAGDCKHWLRTQPILEFGSDALSQSPYWQPFNFRRHLPHLAHLGLLCRCYALRTAPAVAQLVKTLLPAGLQSLTMPHLAQLDPSVWAHLPQGITLSLITAQSRNKIEAFLAAAPHVRFSHLKLKASRKAINDFNFFRTLPTPSISFYDREMTAPWLNSISAFFADTSSTTPHRPLLTSLSTEGWPAASTLSLTHPISSLRSIQTEFNSPAHWPDLESLAPNLEQFRAPLDTTGGLVVHRKLTDLDINCMNFPAKFNDLFSALPTNLLILRLRPQFRWLDKHMLLLPHTLTELHLDNGSATAPLDQAFFQSLPPALTHLNIAGSAFDTDIQHAPLSLTKLGLNLLHVTGALLSAEDTEWSYGYNGALSRSSSGSFKFGRNLPLFQPAIEDMIVSALDAIKLRLPPTLTHITLSQNISRESKPWAAQDLPHLTSLDLIDTAVLFLFRECRVPSLTHLSANYFNFGSRDQNIVFPKSITSLTAKPNSGDIEFMVSSFAPQIRILNTSDRVIRTLTLAIFLNLETLSLPWNKEHFNPPGSKTKPIIAASLTSLTVNHYFRMSPEKAISYHFGHLPRLRSLHIPTEIDEDEMDEIYAAMPNVAFQCRTLRIKHDSTLIPTSFDEARLEIDFSSAVAEMAKIKWPLLKLEGNHKIEFFMYTSVLERLRTIWPSNLTKLTFGRGIFLRPNFGKFLPSSLKCLHVLDAEGVGSGTPWHLPASITDLSIRSYVFTTEGYKRLPRGLVTLRLFAGKFCAGHAKALPRTLTHLNITTRRLHATATRFVPEGLERFELNGYSACTWTLRRAVKT